MKNSNKQIFLSFEGIVAGAFLILAAMTVFSVYEFSSAEKSYSRSDSMLASYRDIFESIRTDFRYNSLFKAEDNRLVVFNSKNQKVARYIFENSTVTRYGLDNNGRTIIENIKSISFKRHSDFNNLMLLKILPEDETIIPVFSSFAIRGHLDVQ